LAQASILGSDWPMTESLLAFMRARLRESLAS